MTLRLAFMGTPAFAVPVLEALAERHEVAAVYTRAPSPAGRGMRLKPSPVQAEAERRGIPVETPATLRSEEAVATLAGHRPDIAVVVAYGMLLPRPLLEVPRAGCLNIHASLLPRWRGAAPIQRAIIAGDAETGIAVMRMEEGLDTGPVALTERCPIAPDATSGDLHELLARNGAALILQALDRLEAGTLVFAPQPEDGVTYARKIGNEEARIDWSATASAVHDWVRGLSPFPGAFFETDLGRGRERVKVLRTVLAGGSGPAGSILPDGAVACGERAVRLLTVQRAGRAPVAAEEFWRGIRLEPGASFV